MATDDSDADNKPNTSDGEGAPRASSSLPSQLRNWRVVEIEGESSAVEESAEPAAAASAPAVDFESRLCDASDEFVLLTVPQRDFDASPGEEVVIGASVLNNSDKAIDLVISLQGRLNPSWAPELPLRIQLQPGERHQADLTLQLPDGPSVIAGEHAFAIAAAPKGRPQRCSRAACTLQIRRKSHYRLGLIQPAEVKTTWWSPTGAALLPINNLSNHKSQFRVTGVDSERSLLFEFDAPGKYYPEAGQATFILEPGERANIGVTIIPRRQTAVSFARRELSYRIAVQMLDTSTSDAAGASTGGPSSVQTVAGRVVAAALIGPWQMAALAGALILVMLTMVLTSASVLVALRPVPEPQVVAPTALPAPAFALILSLDEPAPTRAAAPLMSEEPIGVSSPAPTAIVVTAPNQDGIPVVQAGQVSAPGEATQPPLPIQSRPTPIAVTPAESGSMTYADMFREIAFRYDINWRLLASVGYVESGFDSNAVGSRGSLGLMQVHPNTWQEWAPKVDAVDAFDTYSNVLVAAVYLDYLRATLGQAGYPQTEWMLAAYNWGPDKVLNLLSTGGEWTNLPPEVQEYATDVLRIAQSIPE